MPLPDDSGVVYVRREDGWDTSWCSLMLHPMGSGSERSLATWDCSSESKQHTALSPDGTRVAMTTAWGGEGPCDEMYDCTALRTVDLRTGRIDVLDLAGYEDPVQVDAAYGPAWSPDGARLLFASTRGWWSSDAPSGLEVINLDGTGRTVLETRVESENCYDVGEGCTDRPLADFAFSPDGSAISYAYGDGELHVVRGGVATELWGPRQTEWGADGYAVGWLASDGRAHAWSSDGARIAVVDQVDYGYRVVDARSGAITYAPPPRTTPPRPTDQAIPHLFAPAAEDWVAYYRRPVAGDDFRLWIEAAPGAAPVDLGVTMPTEQNRMNSGAAHRGSFVTYYDDSMYPEYEYRAVVTFANLGVRLVARRPPGAPAFEIEGTAADANLAGWELTARRVGEGVGSVLARSSAPALADTLARWAPPGPGLYDLTLTASDKAGNRRERRVRVNYDEQPFIANLTAEPRYLSPNGDGVQDFTRISYTATSTGPAGFVILDGASAPVRTTERHHDLAGPYELVWDGRDDLGAPLRDGAYSLQVDGTAMRLVVDKVAPDAAIALGAPSSRYPGEREYFFPVTRWAWVEDESGLRNAPIAGLVTPRAFRARDLNPKEWFLEEATAAAPDAFSAIESGSESIGPTQGDGYQLPENVPVEATRGRRWRVRATDRAGNPATSGTVAVPPDLFILAMGEAEALDPARGAVRVDGEVLPRVDLLDQLYDADGDREPPQFQPQRWAFWLAPTFGQEVVSYFVKYQPDLGYDAGQWTFDYANVELVAENLATWDARAVPPGDYLLEVVAVDRDGHRWPSRALKMRRVGELSFSTCMSFAHGERMSATLKMPVSPWGWQDSVPPGTVVVLDRPKRDEDGAYWTSLGAIDAERAFPIGTSAPRVELGLTWAWDESFDTAGLTQCEYFVWLLRADGSTLPPFDKPRFMSLCSPRVVESRLEQGSATVELAENFREPMRWIEVYTRDPSDDRRTWTYAGTTPGFEARSAPFTFSISAAARCTKRELRLVTHLADGTVRDTDAAFPPFEACEAIAPPLEISCTEVDVTAPAREGDAPLCQALPAPRFLSEVVATSPNNTIVTVRAGLYPQSGAAPILAPLGGFAPGPRVATVATFESTALPEGSYVPFAEALAEDGSSARKVLGPEAALVVDRTPPVLALEYPAEGARVCPEVKRAPDGTAQRSVPVRGRIEDDHLERWSVRFAPAGGASSPVGARTTSRYRPTLESGELARIDATALRPGEYEVSLEARDASGSSFCAAPRTFALAAGVSLAAVRTSTPVFSPDDDGAHDLARVAFDLAGEGTLALEVASADGTVRPLGSMPAAAGPGEYAWDGTAAGVRLPDGDHVLRLEARDACGETDAASVPIAIDTEPPIARLDVPAGESVAGVLGVVGEASDEHLDRWELSLGAGESPTELTTIASSRSGAAGLLAAIDVTSLAPGPYAVRLLAVDRVGHSAGATARFVAAPPLDAAIAVAPSLVSPNGDGVLDATVAVVTLRAPAEVTLELVDAGGAPIATLVPRVALPAGAHPVELGPGLLAGFLDADYAVRLHAVGATGEILAAAPLGLDTAPPELGFATPAPDEWVRGEVDVVPSARDRHLASWSLALTRDAASLPLATGSSEPVGVQAALRDLPDGAHALVLEAADAAGNRASSTWPFTVDATPPAVSFSAPLGGAFVSGLRGGIAVSGRVEEAHLARATLEAEGPRGRRVLYEGATAPPQGPLATWDVLAEDDGPATLVLTAVDRAGNTGRAEIAVVLDSTPPAAHIDAPRDAPLGPGGDLVGTASDANLERYAVAISDGAPGVAGRFVTLREGTSSITGAALATLGSPPADGPYTARVVALDRAGNEASDEAGFTVDTTPPPPPLALAATVQRPRDVHLAWSPAGADAVGYHVLRAGEGGALVRLTGTPVPVPAYVDADRPDGAWRYAVVAVDAVGLESARSNEARAIVDATPPTVDITSPHEGDAVSGVFDVSGVAYGDGDLAAWRLYAGPPGGEALVAASSFPAYGAILGQADVTGRPEDGSETLRLEAEDLAGNSAAVEVHVRVDNAPPAAPTLLSVTAAGRDATATWVPSAELDVVGYLVYRDGALANAPVDAPLDELAGYLVRVPAFTYLDPSLGDGTYVYTVRAMDAAGNLSPASNELAVTVEAGPARARIVSPAPLARVGARVLVVADTADRDVASVQLQVRAGTGAFAPLGPTLTRFPWAASLDPSAYASPVLELRAVATDRGGRADPAPASVFVFRAAALEPPAAVAQVDGADVELAWSGATPAAAVAGHQLLRDGDLLQPDEPLRGTAAASSTASGSPAYASDGSWYSAWRAGAGSASWWQLTFASPALVTRVAAFPRGTTPFTIELRVQGVYVPLAAGLTSAVELDVAPLLADALRVSFQGAGGGLEEVSGSALGLVAGATASDAGVALGDHVYRVVGRGLFGEEAGGEAAARVYRPALSAAASVTADPWGALSGNGAAAGAAVEISGAGGLAATVTADAGGAFAASVPLARGGNAFTARATDAAGNRSLPSDPLAIEHDPVPEVGLSLSVAGVSGGDVALAFTVDGDATGIARFDVRRSGAGGESSIGSVAPAGRDYVDRELPNGSYSYVVTACNAHDECGPPSNRVAATVWRAPPMAPEGLTVRAPPGGGALELAWAWSGGDARFLVERALDPAGAFDAVNAERLAVELRHLDAGLENGRTYWYRVRAVDASGNASAPSDVASGTPWDVEPPPAPRYVAPTVAGSPIVVGHPEVTLEGFAEPGSLVDVVHDGRLVATVAADRLAVRTTPLTTRLPASGAVESSPDGAHRAYAHYTWGSEIVVEGGAEDAVVFAIEGQYFSRPRFSADGGWVAFDGYGPPSWRAGVYAGELATGAHRLLSDPAVSASAPRFAPSSARVAFAEAAPTSRVVVVDVATGARQVVVPAEPQPLTAPQWLDEQTLVALRPETPWGPYTLVRVDLASGATSPLFASPYVETAFAVARGGGALAVAAQGPTGALDVFVVDPASASARAVGSDVAYDTSPAFSPDGTRLAFLKDGDLAVLDRPTGELLRVPTLGYGQLAWTSAGLAFADGQTSLVDWGGAFVVEHVRLARGRNVFGAFATDGAGLRSGPADPIEVILDAGSLADLVVSAVLQPGVPLVGDAANALVTVRNAGGVPAVEPEVAVRVLGSDGSVRAAPVVRLAGEVHPGAAATVAVPLDLVGLTGPQQLVAVADPSGAIPDADRASNQVVVPFVVAVSPVLSLDVAAAPREVEANGVVAATITLVNPGVERAALVRTALRDPGGVLAVAAADQAYAPLASGAAETFQRALPVGRIAPGPYLVVSEAISDGEVLARAEAPVVVLRDGSAGIALAAARARFFSDEPIELLGRVTNQSENAVLAGASYELRLTDPLGTVVHVEEQPVPALALGAPATIPTRIAAFGAAPGEHLATATLRLEGEAVATATAPVRIVGRPVLTGSLAVAGAGEPPAVPAGSGARVAVTLSSAGSVGTEGTTARVRVVEPDAGAIVAEAALDVGALAPGATFARELVLDTTAWPLGVLGVTLSADHDGLTEDVLATARLRVADARPPTLVVENLHDGMFVRGDVAPSVHVRDDASGTTAVRVAAGATRVSALALATGTALDGRWTGALALAPDGPHALVFSAADAEGNDGAAAPQSGNPVTVTVVSDTLPPMLSILGVEAGRVYGDAVSPLVAASDAHLASVSARLDGVPFASGTAIETDGEHAIHAQAEDRASNRSVAAVRFAVDRTPPVIQVLGVVDGERSARAVGPLVEVADPHLAGWNALVNGVPFVNGMSFAADGAYELAVEAWDVAGHRSAATVSFTVDTAPPRIALTGFTEGQLGNRDVTPGYEVVDEDLVAALATLDGASFVPGPVVAAEGTHVLAVSAVDAAHNAASASGRFTIDKTPPAISVTGVLAGEVTRRDVLALVTVADLHPGTHEVTLDGAPLPDGTVVSAEGDHVLRVVATDAAGNEADREEPFTIDRTPPELRILGFADGAVVAHDVEPGYEAVDSHLGPVAAWMDGVPLLPGMVVGGEGLHLVEVEAEDLAGNRASASATFTIDLTPPSIWVEGCEDGAMYATTIAPAFGASDDHLAEVHGRLDGAPYASGTPVGVEGAHALVVTASDRAGNSVTDARGCTVDRTPPEITITGVADGAEYAQAVTPAVLFLDPHLATTTITLDGAPFEGAPVADEGPHVLFARASDRAGNASERTVSFLVRASGGLEVHKYAAAGVGRVLALVRSGTCAPAASDAARVTAFLEGHLGGAERLLRVVTDEEEFLEALRSGAYNVFLLVSVGSGDRTCNEGAERCDDDGHQTPSAHVRRAIARELTELVHSGRAGAVTFRARPEDLPDYRELLGADLYGWARESDAVEFGPGPLAALPLLEPPSRSVRIKLVGAEVAATYADHGSCGDAEVAAVTRELGLGRSVTFGFDVAAALPEEDAGAVLVGAVEWVTPPRDAGGPLGVATVEVAITARGAAGEARVQERLHAALRAVAAPGGTVDPAGTRIDWAFPVGDGDRRVLRYVARLPEEPGTYRTETDVVVARATGESSYGPFGLDLLVEEDGAALVANARAVVEQLPRRGHDRVILDRIERALRAVETRPIRRRSDVEENLDELFTAVADAKRLEDASPTAVRLALDDLIRYWEARWSVF
jgi:Tol biopolymer transport system component